MKKKTFAIFLSSLLIISFCACSASGGGSPSNSAFYGDYDEAREFVMNDAGGGMTGAAPAADPMPAPETAANYYAYSGESGAGTTAGALPAPPSIDSAKIIYSAYARIESMDFDATVAGVYAMIARFGGFVENSSVTDSDYYSKYYGGVSYRSADFTIRFPSEFFNEVTGSLSDLGNVPYCNTNAENITSRYYDVQSRLNSYLTQETRLLQMLEKAESLEDMLAIEDRLADVRYNIESLTTSLRGMDSLINYSTLNLSVTEVAEYTKETPVVRNYWQQIGDGFSSTLSATGRLFTGLFKWLIILTPVLVLLAVLAVISFFAGKYCRKRRMLNKQNKNKPL